MKTSLPRKTSGWSFETRAPRTEPTSFLSSLFGPADPGLQTSLLPGETEEAREKRLRKEDTEVLEYFDELIIGESDYEGVWRDAEEGEIDGLEDESSDEEEGESGQDSEGGLHGGEEDEERLGGEGDEGTTRRILNSIYALEEQEGESSEGDEDDGEEDASQASLTLSEQEEYQELMEAWNSRTVAEE